MTIIDLANELESYGFHVIKKSKILTGPDSKVYQIVGKNSYIYAEIQTAANGVFAMSSYYKSTMPKPVAQSIINYCYGI